MHIGVFGAGYVGLVQSAVLAKLGHSVVCCDIDPRKVQVLSQGRTPIYEAGLEELMAETLGAGRLTFTTSASECLEGSEIVFLCVGTPGKEDGQPDLGALLNLSAEIGRLMRSEMVIVTKSTVPIGTTELVRSAVAGGQSEPIPFDVASNPEFLSEGTALADALNGDRIIIGAQSRASFERVAACYQGLSAPILWVSPPTAEAAKYAANAFLAAKISFMNSMAELCEATGADAVEVAKCMGLDKRIGPAFLGAGLGYGGSCLPKDVQALISMLERHGCSPDMLAAVKAVNDRQARRLVEKARQALNGLAGRKILVLGIAFKPNTDDIRESRALAVMELLSQEGAEVMAHDPVAKLPHGFPAQQVESVTDAADGSDALVLATEWPAYRTLDWRSIASTMRKPLLFDGRNMLDPQEMQRLGFHAWALGRALGVPS